MMFVDSDKRWLLTSTDDQFVDRCTIYWQLTVWFWNYDIHCEIRGQRPVNICYYGVGVRIFKDEMSSAFDRVLLFDMLLGLWIQPILAADCGKHLCILPCTSSACETVWNKDRCTEPSYIRHIRNWIYDEHPLSCLSMGFWNRPHTPLSIPYLLNRCQELAGECGRFAPAGEGLGHHQKIDQVWHCCPRSQQANLPQSRCGTLSEAILAALLDLGPNKWCVCWPA